MSATPVCVSISMSFALPSCSAGKCWNVIWPFVALVTASMKGRRMYWWAMWPFGRASATRSVTAPWPAARVPEHAKTAKPNKAPQNLFMKTLPFAASVSHHLAREPQDQVRDGDEQGDHDEMGEEMRHRAVEDLAHGAAGVPRHHEAVEPDRRRDHADLGRDDLDHAEPERIVT